MDSTKRKDYNNGNDYIFPKCTACVANAEWVDNYSFEKNWDKPCKCSKFFYEEPSDWGTTSGGDKAEAPNGYSPATAASCKPCPVGCPSCSKNADSGDVTCNAPCADGYYFSKDDLCYKIKNCKSF